MNRRLSQVMAIVVAIVAAAGVIAQEQVDLSDMAQRMKRNQEDVRQYTWTSRITYDVNGARKRSDTYTVRYDFNGTLEKVQLSSIVDPEKIRGADGKKLSKKEREAAREFAFSAKSQLVGYLSPLLAEKAVSTATATENEDTLVLHSRDVVTKGDKVTITLDRATRKPLNMEATSTIGDSPVTLEVRFDSAAYGPSFVVKSVTRSSWKGLELVISTANMDFAKR